MIRIAVAEDDAQYREQLCRYIEDFGKENGQTFKITPYADGDELVEQFRSQFDIILMDIEMPLLNGMEAAAAIRRTDQEVIIIFITNMAQYAIRGYEVAAMDYILKPVNYFAFAQRLGRAVRRLGTKQESYLAVPVKGGVVKLAAGEVTYIESQGHQLTYHTRTGAYVSAGAIGEAGERLAGQHFFRCNKGCLVNLEHVEGIRDGCAIVAGARLPISRGRKNDFLQALAAYIGGDAP